MSEDDDGEKVYQPVTVKIETRALAGRITRDLRGRFADFRPVIKNRIRPMVEEALRLNFETEGEWGGHPWAELADRTIANKKAKGTLDKGILIDKREQLVEAFTAPSTRLRRVRTTERKFSISIGVPYAKFHQEGTEKNSMPARQVVPDPMPVSFIEDLKNVIRDYVVQVTLK